MDQHLAVLQLNQQVLGPPAQGHNGAVTQRIKGLTDRPAQARLTHRDRRQNASLHMRTNAAQGGFHFR